MKIRTDFVTNSSSSGYVVISIKKTNGETIETQSEYSAGFGGYFWNTRNPEAELNVSFLNARNGEDILKVLRDHIESFDSFIIDGSYGGQGRAFRDALMSMDNVDDLLSIYIEEDTHFDMGGSQGARYYHTFYRHNNRTFYPEDWQYYLENEENSVHMLNCLDEGKAEEPMMHLAEAIGKYAYRYGLYLLLYLSDEVLESFGLKQEEIKKLRSLAGNGSFADTLRIPTSDWMILMAQPKFITDEVLGGTLSVVGAGKTANKSRDYVKYVIQLFPDYAIPWIKAYNGLLHWSESELSPLLPQEVREFIGQDMTEAHFPRKHSAPGCCRRKKCRMRMTSSSMETAV